MDAESELEKMRKEMEEMKQKLLQCEQENTHLKKLININSQAEFSSDDGFDTFAPSNNSSGEDAKENTCEDKPDLVGISTTNKDKKTQLSLSDDTPSEGGEVELFNFRDISVADKDKIEPERIFRSSCVTRAGSSKSSIKKTLTWLTEVVGIKTIIDFRDKKEVEQDPLHYLVDKQFAQAKDLPDTVDSKKIRSPVTHRKVASNVSLNRSRLATSQKDHLKGSVIAHEQLRQSKSPKKDTPKEVLKSWPKDERPQRIRYNIPLMTTKLKLKGMVWHSTSKQTKMNMVKAATKIDTKGVVKVFAETTMNPMGLLGMNKLMLTYAQNEICKVLRVCSDPANYPIMYHCSSGKDRTGLITALILKVCGVSDEAIIENYAQSQDFLAPVMHLIEEENSKKYLVGFDGTPPETMADTFAFIRNNKDWGGSECQYLNYIGFSFSEQNRLCQALSYKAGKDLTISEIERSENARELQWIKELKEENRWSEDIIKVGMMKKLDFKGTLWRVRFFVLTPDKLIYFKHSPRGKLAGQMPTITMVGVRGQSMTRQSGGEFGLELITLKKTYKFYVDSGIQLQNWLQELKSVIPRFSDEPELSATERSKSDPLLVEDYADNMFEELKINELYEETNKKKWKQWKKTQNSSSSGSYSTIVFADRPNL